MTPRKSTSMLYALYLIFFLDGFGMGLVFPLFAQLVPTPLFQDIPLLATTTHTPFFFGILISAFSFAQFCSLKLFFSIQTRFQLKPALLWSIFLMSIGFFISGAAIEISSYTYLFLGRIFTGFFAANIALCLFPNPFLITHPEKASLYHNKLHTIMLWSLMLGILTGGLSSNFVLFPSTSYAMPFWLTGFMALGIFGFSLFTLNSPKDKETPHFKFPISLIALWKDDSIESYKSLYLVFFFFLLGWIAFLQFASLYFYVVFQASNSFITGTLAGITIAVLSAYNIFSKPYIKLLPFRLFFFLSLVGLIIFSILLFFVTDQLIASLLHIAIALHAGLMLKGISHKLSLENHEIYSKVLFLKSSTAIFAAFITPLIGGFIALYSIPSLFLYMAVCFVISLTTSISLRSK